MNAVSVTLVLFSLFGLLSCAGPSDQTVRDDRPIVGSAEPEVARATPDETVDREAPGIKQGQKGGPGVMFLPPKSGVARWWYEPPYLFFTPEQDAEFDAWTIAWQGERYTPPAGSLQAIDSFGTGYAYGSIQYAMAKYGRSCVILLHLKNLVRACTDGRVATTAVDFSEDSTVGVFDRKIILYDPATRLSYTWDGKGDSAVVKIDMKEGFRLPRQVMVRTLLEREVNDHD